MFVYTSLTLLTSVGESLEKCKQLQLISAKLHGFQLLIKNMEIVFHHAHCLDFLFRERLAARVSLPEYRVQNRRVEW
jgi:hypothetical protein